MKTPAKTIFFSKLYFLDIDILVMSESTSSRDQRTSSANSRKLKKSKTTTVVTDNKFRQTFNQILIGFKTLQTSVKYFV